MSDREKKLLYFALAVVFILGNLLAYKKFYEPRMSKAESDLRQAKSQLEINKGAMETMDVYLQEMDWLKRYEPKPSNVQTTRTRLQQLVDQQAKQNQLEIKTQAQLPAMEDSNLTYHRARFQVRVTGMEEGLYRWLDRLHSPNEFRAITSMRLAPLKEDDTQIDCQVTVEQWFVPEQEGAIQ